MGNLFNDDDKDKDNEADLEDGNLEDNDEENE